MARFNEILVGRYNRYLQKLLAIKGAAVTAVLSTEIQPQITLFHGIETRYLEGWSLFGVSVVINATVGQTDAVRLRNPAGSNVIAVVEKIVTLGNVGGEFQISAGVTSLDLTTGFSAVPLDPRAGNVGSNLSLSSAINSPGPLGLGVFARTNSPANVDGQAILYDNQEIPLLPGSAIQVAEGVANVTMTLTLKWRERFLEDSERT
jgi:hypothetical protein